MNFIDDEHIRSYFLHATWINRKALCKHLEIPTSVLQDFISKKCGFGRHEAKILHWLEKETTYNECRQYDQFL